jgi:2-polyprenyl-3-methyl-5-hydroxy-6-metoxy-1,4-benzoquinol methylase
MFDFAQRSTEPELMDCPDSSGQLLSQTLRQFEWINRYLTPSHRLLRRNVLKRMRAEPSRDWTMLDIGSGGCDLAIWLIGLCRQERISLVITCIDHDTRVVEFSRQLVKPYPEVILLQADATMLLADSPPQHWDFIFSNHLLHHLTTPDVIHLLRQVVFACRVQCIMSDLVRSRLNYFLYSACAKLLLRHSFAYEDGRLSIRRSLTLEEASRLVAEDPGLKSLCVQSMFPGHLVFSKPASSRLFCRPEPSS